MDDGGWAPACAGVSGDAGYGRPRPVYTEAVRAAIVRRLEAGESLAAICRDEAMPNKDTVRVWARQRAEFGAELAAAARAARLRRRRADLARAMRPRDARGRWSTYTHEAGAEICRRLIEGETLISICRGEGMPHYSTVMNWARAVPEFGEAYAEARRLAADWFFDEAREVALAATPGTVWVDRLRFDVIRWAAAKVAPRKYAERVLTWEAVEMLKAARAEAAGETGGFTVILKRYSEVTEEERRLGEEGEP